MMAAVVAEVEEVPMMMVMVMTTVMVMIIIVLMVIVWCYGYCLCEGTLRGCDGLVRPAVAADGVRRDPRGDAG